jgi:hypothetical protein
VGVERTEALARTEFLARTALPIVAILLFALFVGGPIAAAGDTLGHDFLAYHAAAARVIEGEPLYDMSFQATGGFGLFYYPPQFLPLVLPFGFLQPTTAVWAWMAVLLAAFFVGVGLMPVSRAIRWWIVLLAGITWPFAFAIQLGQVGPLLFLLFAIGWRWFDAPVRLGAATALGTAIKLQPAILFAWALLTRRWWAVVVGILVLGLLSIVATILAGVGSWADFVTLVRRVSDPITTERNLTPGAVAFQLGVDAGIAGLIQVASTIVVLLAVVVATLRTTTEAAFLVAVIASQLLSPILWDHYAMLLLLPIAYLCAAGWWWTVLIPISTATVLVGVTPPFVYPVVFFVTLGATLLAGLRSRGTDPDVIRGFGMAPG